MDQQDTSEPHRDGGRAAWIQQWKTVGPKLAKIRESDLQSLQPATAQATVEALLDLASTFPPRPATSGLVEYQRRIRGRAT